jgi:hypothetical protein
VVADALSRRDPEAESSLAALSAPEFSLFEEIRKELDSSSEALRGCEQWGSWGKMESGGWPDHSCREGLCSLIVKIATSHSILGSRFRP